MVTYYTMVLATARGLTFYISGGYTRQLMSRVSSRWIILLAGFFIFKIYPELRSCGFQFFIKSPDRNPVQHY